MEACIQVNANTAYQNELQYTCDVIFKTFWGIDYILVNTDQNKRDIIQLQFENRTLDLSSVLFTTPPGHWLTKKSHPSTPLREKNLHNLPGDSFLFRSVPVLYGLKDDANESASPFDIDLFGSIFFMLTRYEEAGCDPSDLDSIGRFDERKSLAFKAGFYHRALVNEYLEILWSLINLHGKVGFARKKRKYELIVSHDIDFPLSITNRTPMGFVKNIIGDLYVRKSPGLAFDRVKAKMLSVLGKPFKDPYSTFDYLMQCAEKFNYRCTFNFIPGNEPFSMDGVRSVDYALDTPYFHNILISIHQRGHFIGFHPSFITLNSFENTAREFETLVNTMRRCNIAQKEIGGRQHYLRWRNPDTWRNWNELGLSYDSSVGYSDLYGFRTGTCYEYPVYDLFEKKKLSLLEVPLTVMDTGTLDLSSSKFTEQFVLDTYKISKAYNGTFSLLYHNNNVASKQQRTKYEKILEAVSRS